MAEILGIGSFHGPHPRLTDESMANIYFRHNLQDPAIPDFYKDPAKWPQAMRDEWGDDEGLVAGRRHRDVLLKAYREARRLIDDFRPDVIFIFGDDQYENFQEDMLPPFCIVAMDELNLHREEHRVHNGIQLGVPIERPPLQESARGSKKIGTFIADELVSHGFDVACSWKFSHKSALGHAFYSTIDYLDWERVGFPYVVVPIHVSCYGQDLRVPIPGTERVIGRIMEDVAVRPPISPPPWRCYDLGKALGKIVNTSPYRAVIMGSSSWSHASLTPMHGYLWGDVDSDHEHYEQLRDNKFACWRDIDPAEIRRSGQHEMLNWICLAGAMENRTADVLAFSESYIFNSSKCVAAFH